MSDTPDLSKIVGLIMQNPSLISEIQSLVQKGDNADTPEVKDEVKEVKEEEPTIAKPASTRESRNERRARLLSAMKPYLKDERARSIDTMLMIADMLDTVRSK